MVLTKRQKQILDFIDWQTRRLGYAPTLSEIGGHFGLSSLATVHKHLRNLEAKGLIRRRWNQSRAVEIMRGVAKTARAVELPLLGVVSAGSPIESVEIDDTLAVPGQLLRGPDTFVLRVRGDSMIDEQIRDGDFILVQSGAPVSDGSTVVALVRGEATVKKFYHEGNKVRLQPANDRVAPIVVESGEVEIRGVVVAVIRKY